MSENERKELENEIEKLKKGIIGLYMEIESLIKNIKLKKYGRLY